MLFYIMLGMFLIPFCAVELCYGSRIKPYAMDILLAAVYFVAVAGFRDQTGYDWYAYRAIFEGIGSSGSFIDAIAFGSANGSEYGFSLLVYLLTAVGAQFWSLQAVVSCFNFYSFVRLNSALGNGSVRGLYVYYCWLFLVLQMGVMRMSIAVSILSLGLVYLLSGRKYKFIVSVIFASSFHIFSILLGLIMFLSRSRLSKRAIFTSIFVLFGIYLVGIDPVGSSIRFLSGYMPAFIFVKVDFYLQLADVYQRGAGELLYKLSILSIFIFVALKLNWDNFVERYLLNLNYVYILFLLLFWKYPVFHDRIKYLVIMPFFYLFFIVLNRQKAMLRVCAGSLVIALSMFVLVYQVTGAMFYPYTPYFNIAEDWLGLGKSDGEERTLNYYKEYNQEMGRGG